MLLNCRGKYLPIAVYEISRADICGEICDYGKDNDFDGKFEANIYQDGQLSDIELNGWTFSYHIEGTYHLPGTYSSVSYVIECLDPNDDELKLYNTPFKIRFSERGVLRDYMETVYIYSRFENADIAAKFNILSRIVDEGMYGGRGRDPMKITYGGVLDLIKFFRDYYEELEKHKRKNKLLLEKIKETVNGAIDFLKKRLNFDKIE